MKTNKTIRNRTPAPRTFGGAIAGKTNHENQLIRLVMANMMFEDQFYIDGESSAKILADCIDKCDPEFVAEVAVQARTEFKLRHVPLFLARELARNPKARHVVAELLPKIVNRADEIAEFISIYWKEGKAPLANCVKKGLSACFEKFSEYAFAKYSGKDSTVSLRDAMFLVRPKPSKGRAALYKRIANQELKSPETWENRLSRGEDKKAVFTEMIRDGELGAMALIRNLRNMEQSGVPSKLIREAIMSVDTKNVLPFRFLSAMKHAPSYSAELESAMIRGLAGNKILSGKTLLVLDVSGSMGGGVGGKSEITRFEAAAALAMLATEVCEDVTIYATAGNDGSRIHKTEKVVGNLHGLKLKEEFDKKIRTLGGGGIFLTQCMKYISEREDNFDRVIVFTDEQDCDTKLKPSEAKRLGKNNYIVNIAAYKNGIGGKEWTTISGFSEQILNYIAASEAQ